jgi:hypothetical protein
MVFSMTGSGSPIPLGELAKYPGDVLPRAIGRVFHRTAREPRECWGAPPPRMPWGPSRAQGAGGRVRPAWGRQHFPSRAG